MVPGTVQDETCYPLFIADEDWVSQDTYPVSWFDETCPSSDARWTSYADGRRVNPSSGTSS